MKRFVRRTRRGFSLVELLAVVLILAVLAAVAVPLYINTRKTSAARACKANIAAIAASESAYVLRNGSYCTMATLAASNPEGLAGEVTCPLNRAAYGLRAGAAVATDFTTSDVTDTTTTGLTIGCPNQSIHQGDLGLAATVKEWQRFMPGIGTEVAVP